MSAGAVLVADGRVSGDKRFFTLLWCWVHTRCFAVSSTGINLKNGKSMHWYANQQQKKNENEEEKEGGRRRDFCR